MESVLRKTLTNIFKAFKTIRFRMKTSFDSSELIQGRENFFEVSKIAQPTFSKYQNNSMFDTKDIENARIVSYKQRIEKGQA